MCVTEEIPQNVINTINLIKTACEKCGRDPNSVTLVAATKMNDAERVKLAIKSGVTCCGENRAQELTQKFDEKAYEGADLQFIGRLQTNKVKYLVGKVSLIHSVDSQALVKEISKQAVKAGIIQDILIEINIGGESAKGGILPEKLPEFLELCSQYPGIFVRGLMTVAPQSQNSEDSLPYFRQMNKLFVDNQEKKYDNILLEFLSMGMSSDFFQAIACGATHIRIGSSIFGKREYL